MESDGGCEWMGVDLSGCGWMCVMYWRVTGRF